MHPAGIHGTLYPFKFRDECLLLNVPVWQMDRTHGDQIQKAVADRQKLEDEAEALSLCEKKTTEVGDK